MLLLLFLFWSARARNKCREVKTTPHAFTPRRSRCVLPSFLFFAFFYFSASCNLVAQTGASLFDDDRRLSSAFSTLPSLFFAPHFVEVRLATFFFLKSARKDTEKQRVHVPPEKTPKQCGKRGISECCSVRITCCLECRYLSLSPKRAARGDIRSTRRLVISRGNRLRWLSYTRAYQSRNQGATSGAEFAFPSCLISYKR